jgi:hypothetical protein
MKTSALLTSALLAIGAAALPSAAAASVNITGIALNDGYYVGNLALDNVGTANDFSVNNVGVGRITLTGTDTVTSAAVKFSGYCIDIMDFLHTGLFDIVPLAAYSPLNATQKAQLLTLVSNADPLLTAGSPNADVSAAIQLAIWEIVYETSGTFNAGAGVFKATTATSAVNLANTYLGNVTGGSWTAKSGYALNTLVSINGANQEQLFLTAVPEPATWAMMIAGFGLVGGALRSQRRQARAALA